MKKLFIFIFLLIYSNNLFADYSNFYFGHCTYYVAKNTFVNWGGNAKDWINNATDRNIYNSPIVGGVVVFDWVNYSEYWHVGIVENIINDNFFIISEMNYKRLNQITYRIINVDDINIKGFIF